MHPVSALIGLPMARAIPSAATAVTAVAARTPAMNIRTVRSMAERADA